MILLTHYFNKGMGCMYICKSVIFRISLIVCDIWIRQLIIKLNNYLQHLYMHF